MFAYPFSSGFLKRTSLNLALLAMLFAHPVQASELRKIFTNSVTEMPAKVSKTVRALQPAHLQHTLEIEIPLQMRDYAKLTEKIGHGEKISRAELEREHLPTAEDYDALLDWLRGEGFTITHTDANRLAVFARGTIAQIQHSLQVQMATVTVDKEDFHTATSHPQLPARIAAPVLGINGLQPYGRMIKRSAVTPNVPPFLVSEILGAYNAKNLGVTGAGQKIAILID
ncbi:MAG: protease pro-enzyme activation domain-containing protein, partial [Verrucomicrobiaceae bacterium]